MSDLNEFRSNVREWLEANCPHSCRGPDNVMPDVVWGGRRQTFENPDVKLWLDRLIEKGWTVPGWDPIYGGAGLGKEEQKILAGEMQRLGTRSPLFSFGMSMLAPVLLQYANEEQKLEHLPKIARGEIRWAQGYSEPGSGSDLASLKCKCVRDGDEYVVNGQKIWTSQADQSDWIFCLVRTDSSGSKHEGISFLLIDMETPGVTTRPIELISGASPFCETFFEDVRVPVSNLVHEENKGWDVAKAVLSHERAMLSEALGSLEEDGIGSVLRLARDTLTAPEGVLPEPGLRMELAQSQMDQLCYQSSLARVDKATKAGQGMGPESSMFKLYLSEWRQRLDDLYQRVGGSESLVWEGDQLDPATRQATRDWLYRKAFTILGGTSEIQLNILAKRVLGLPQTEGRSEVPRVLTEEQQLLQDMVSSYTRKNRVMDSIRDRRDSPAGNHFDRQAWEQMAELGWIGIPFPQDVGGLGLGYAEFGLVLEELGRGLIPSPLISTVCLGAAAVNYGGTDAQRQDLLSQVCSGSLLLTLAYQESARHDPWNIDLRAEKDDQGYTLDGEKVLVLDAVSADKIIVAARTSGVQGEREGLSLFVVDSSADGVSLKNRILLDGQSASTVILDNVRLGPESLLGEEGLAADCLEKVFQVATVAISAELLGNIQESFDITLDYLKIREQFGQKIGEFQALQHRAARWFCEIELSRSIVDAALNAIDSEDTQLSQFASVCKARVSDTGRLSGQESIQLHGGIGVTDEHDIGLYMKRARVCEMLLGDSTYHLNEYAKREGY